MVPPPPWCPLAPLTPAISRTLPLPCPHCLPPALLCLPQVALPDLGMLERARVGHDSKGCDLTWHLDRMTVQDISEEGAGKAPKPFVSFPCGGLLCPRTAPSVGVLHMWGA